MLKLAEASKDLQYYADRTFKSKFGTKRILIGNFTHNNPPNEFILAFGALKKGFNEWFGTVPSDALSIEKDSIIIRNAYFGLKMLKSFGKSIQTLELNFENAETNAAKLIGQYVDKYCSDTLTELKLVFREGDALSLFKKPFKNVRKVTFVQKSSYNTVARPTNRTFPALRELIVEDLIITDVDYANCQFPHLESLSIIKPGPLSGFSVPKQLIDVNPQVQSFTCEQCGFNVVGLANTKFSQLEDLTLIDFYSKNEEIRFENVRKLTTVDSQGPSFEYCLNVHVPNLVELHVHTDELKLDKMASFLENHRNLSKFSLHYNWLKDGEFQQITTMLPNLQEMSFMKDISRSLIFVKSSVVIEFLQRHDKLMKFEMNECKDSEDKQNLREQLAKGWEIEDFQAGLSFQRKFGRRNVV